MKEVNEKVRTALDKAEHAVIEAIEICHNESEHGSHQMMLQSLHELYMAQKVNGAKFGRAEPTKEADTDKPTPDYTKYLKSGDKEPPEQEQER